MKCSLIAVTSLVALTVLAFGGLAFAGTITGTNLDRGDVKSDVIFPVYGSFDVHMGYKYDYSAGTGILSNYNGNGIITFCGDLENVHVNDVVNFTLNAVTSAPAGGYRNYGLYTVAEADHLNAWMTAALQLGLVDNRGFFNNTPHNIGINTYSSDDVARAVQFGVWNSLLDPADGNAWLYKSGGLQLVAPSGNVINCISDISSVATGKLGGPMITQILVNDGNQDMVVLVPEPGTLVLLAAAGLSLLGYSWRRHRS